MQDNSGGVEDGPDIDDLLEDRTRQRSQQAEDRQNHADDGQPHAAERGLQRDASHARGDVDKVIEAFQGRIENDRVGRLRSDVGV